MSNFHAVLVGGGNIGSHAVDQLCRIPEVTRLTIVDHDRYESRNAASQQIDARDIGKPKAIVLARRARRLRPDLDVVPLVDRLESVPLGLLRGVLLAALDSRRSRMSVNEVAWRLGSPWIDSAVSPTDWQVRVRVYRPGPEAACLECAWSEADYAAIEQVVPCQGGMAVAPTNAPSSLGAIAAGLMVLEYRKILSGDWSRVLEGRETFHDVKHHRQFVTRYTRNLQCRFDHKPWAIEPLPGDVQSLTLGECLDLQGPSAKALKAVRGPFVRRLRCNQCEHFEAALHVGPPKRKPCSKCGGDLVSGGFDTDDWLVRDSLTAQELRRPLHRLGLRPGDVLSLRGPGRTTYHQLAIRGGFAT